MRIRAVTPIITESFEPLILEEFAGVARPDTEISNAFLESGPASIESYFDEAVAVPGIIARVRQAEREGVDAVIINCSLPPREGDCGIRSVVTALSLKGAYRDASIHI